MKTHYRVFRIKYAFVSIFFFTLRVITCKPHRKGITNKTHKRVLFGIRNLEAHGVFF